KRNLRRRQHFVQSANHKRLRVLLWRRRPGLGPRESWRRRLRARGERRSQRGRVRAPARQHRQRHVPWICARRSLRRDLVRAARRLSRDPTILCDTARGATAAMLVRAVIVVSLVLITAGGAAQAQNCPDPPTRACVLEQALAAARAISDEGARAQALSPIALGQGA